MESETILKERELQQQFAWSRAGQYANLNVILGEFMAETCLEHARGDSLLDLACGDGLLTRRFVERFSRVVGVDASATHLAEARERLPGVEFHESLLEEIDLDEKFDNVCMLNVLEHVVDPIAALQKAASHLAPGGRLMLTVPNANAINRRIAVRMGTLTSCEELSPYDIDIAGHRRSYTRETFVRDLRDAGLEVPVVSGILYKSLSTPQFDWLLENGPWEEGGFGWGRVGAEKEKDWRAEFCRASYEIGKELPDDCNLIFACATRSADAA